MSSSSDSEDENYELLREAADSQFINDSMYRNDTKTVNGTTAQDTSKKRQQLLPSLRPTKDENQQFTILDVTPEFQNFVAQRLSNVLEEQLHKSETTTQTQNHKRKRKNSGIKLFKESSSFVDSKSKHLDGRSRLMSRENQNGTIKLKKQQKASVITKEDLRQVSVSGDDILNKKDIKFWSNRSKAPVFNYKKCNNGKLENIEKTFV